MIFRFRTGAPVLALWVLAASASAASAQPVSVLREENFRREPNGVVLGRLAPGASMQVVGREGNWVQADLEGWVWLASLRASDGELDLVVSASGGENLRNGPSGTIIGRLEEGALLEELGRDPQWARVRRRGWIWSASVGGGRGAATTATAPAPQTTPRGGGPAAGPAQGRGGTPAAGRSSAPAPAARQPTGYVNVGPTGAAILASPDGDTLALATPSRELQIVSRDGNWARVRVDGWVWMPAAAQGTAAPAATLTTLTPQELSANPEAHAGRVVSWLLQFISLERAEAIRTDFRQGEPFLLSRYGGGDGPFVYVAVPPERLTEVEGLVPLERITVTARIRTGASSLTGSPIVDLLSFERSR
jgi:hypothetical protein